MTQTIPPTREKARRKLEKRADEILARAGQVTSEGWPPVWQPHREETDHDRIAVAHTGAHSLHEAALFCMLPSYDPQGGTRKLSELMAERPGAEAEDTETTLATGGGFHQSGKELPKREVWERCRWLGCEAALYSPEKPRRQGNPREVLRCSQEARQDAHAAPQNARDMGGQASEPFLHRGAPNTDFRVVSPPAGGLLPSQPRLLASAEHVGPDVSLAFIPQGWRVIPLGPCTLGGVPLARPTGRAAPKSL